VEAEDFAGAIAVYQRQLPWSQKIPEFFLALATYRLVKEILSSRQLIDRRLPSTPTMPIFYALATVWEFRGQCRCGELTRRTIELDRNSERLPRTGAVASGKLQRGSLGIQQVFAREPNNANAYELMGAMLMQQGRSKEAIAALKSQQRWLLKQCAFAPGICLGEPGNITAGLMTEKRLPR